MRVTRKLALIVVGVVVLVGGGWFILKSRTTAADASKSSVAKVVKTVVSVKKSVPIVLSANGFVTAINTVDVRPQVQNVVRTIHVKEGQDVRAGDLLFTLDARGDASNVAKAQAEIAGSQADLADAQATLRRNEDLLAKKFVAQAVVDTARTKVNTLSAALAAGHASLQSSDVAMGYNQIRASIGGRLGIISVHPGSLAQPAGTALVTISQLDPIAVTFSVPEAELRHVMASYPHGGAPVSAALPGGGTANGKLSFIDNTSDPTSGSIKLKAEFDNPGHRLWPGTYTGVQLVSRTLEDVIVVPAQAIVTGPTDKFVYTVAPDNTVQAKKIAILAIERGQAAVTGLAAGARVVVEGAENLRAGNKVREAVGDAVDGSSGGGGSSGSSGSSGGSGDNGVAAKGSAS